MWPRKILCPIDFSAGSHQAMRVAVRLANTSDAELALVHAWSTLPTAFVGEAVFPASVYQQMNDDAARQLEAAVGDAKALGAKRVRSELHAGAPWTAIVDVLADPQFDVVVIGTHGRTGLARVMLGSVAEKIVRHAPCSVLVVRPDNAPAPFSHALCPVDFSESSRYAVDLAAQLVTPGGAGITLLHMLELPVAYAGEPRIAEFTRSLDKHSADALDNWARAIAANTSVPVTTRTRIGWPGSQTLAALHDDRSVDLVVLGTHGRTGIKRALLGSVAEKVVRHAHCPVLVARKRE